MTQLREQWKHLLPACLVLILCTGTALAEVRAAYLYTLSNFSGRLPYDWVRIFTDQEREETYVLQGNLIRIFNPSGMEIFSFGYDLDLGQLLDVTTDDAGDIILLSYVQPRTIVTRCSFRGVPKGTVEISRLPAGTEFSANRMVSRNGRFYFASLSASSVIVTDAAGVFRERVDFLPLLDLEDRQKVGAEMVGFDVDREGSVLFTIPVVFKVYKYSLDGKLAAFGRPGSAPGRFGVLAGVTSDSQGNLLVIDKLKCVVMVFDKAFNFLAEFGYRGLRPENLIVPDDIAVDRRNRVYVSQGRRRGVSVFSVTVS